MGVDHGTQALSKDSVLSEHPFIASDISPFSSAGPLAPVCADVAPESAVCPYLCPTLKPTALQQTVEPRQLPSQSVDSRAEASGDSVPYYPPRDRAMRSASSPGLLPANVTRMSPENRPQDVRRAYTYPTLHDLTIVPDYMKPPFPHPPWQSYEPEFALTVDSTPQASVSDAQDPYLASSPPSLHSDSSFDEDSFERDNTAPHISAEYSSSKHNTDATSATHLLPECERTAGPGANSGSISGAIMVSLCPLRVPKLIRIPLLQEILQQIPYTPPRREGPMPLDSVDLRPYGVILGRALQNPRNRKTTINLADHDTPAFGKQSLGQKLSWRFHVRTFLQF